MILRHSPRKSLKLEKHIDIKNTILLLAALAGLTIASQGGKIAKEIHHPTQWMFLDPKFARVG
jgi:hypothetical protein